MTMDSPSRDRAVVVHLGDLRFRDHRPLSEAYANHAEVFSVVVIDPSELKRTAFGSPRFSDRRVEWFVDAVTDLRQSYRARGGELIVRVGDTVDQLRRLVDLINPVALYAQNAKTHEERARLERIESALTTVDCRWVWNDVLVDPPEWPVPPYSFPRSFTGFRKKFESKCVVRRPVEPPAQLTPCDIDAGQIPSLDRLGFCRQAVDPRSTIASLQPGESGAWRQLERYFWASDRLRIYKETRNGMTEWGDSSKLSPYLALGLISPVSVFHQVLAYEQKRVSNQSTYWLRFELLWREYFHAMALACGDSLFLRDGVKRISRSWSSDRDAFTRWTQGQTGVPIVDACMRELAATGFSSNRARQISACFLSNYMGVDWRWGAAWFEQHLIDYDPCSNWGNWQYVSGVGTGPQDRVMSMRRQADRYDGSALFTRRWVEELGDVGLDEIQRHTPWGLDDWANREHRSHGRQVQA